MLYPVEIHENRACETKPFFASDTSMLSNAHSSFVNRPRWKSKIKKYTDIQTTCPSKNL